MARCVIPSRRASCGSTLPSTQITPDASVVVDSGRFRLGGGPFTRGDVRVIVNVEDDRSHCAFGCRRPCAGGKCRRHHRRLIRVRQVLVMSAPSLRPEAGTNGQSFNSRKSGPEMAPSRSTPPELTALLLRWGQGDEAALEQLIPLVHRSCSESRGAAWRASGPGTASRRPRSSTRRICGWSTRTASTWQDRAHFLAVSARVDAAHPRGPRAGAGATRSAAAARRR